MLPKISKGLQMSQYVSKYLKTSQNISKSLKLSQNVFKYIKCEFFLPWIWLDFPANLNKPFCRIWKRSGTSACSSSPSSSLYLFSLLAPFSYKFGFHTTLLLLNFYLGSSVPGQPGSWLGKSARFRTGYRALDSSRKASCTPFRPKKVETEFSDENSFCTKPEIKNLTKNRINANLK